MPISSFAAGLGKLNVVSGLGEPLKADIEIIAATPAELEGLTAAIASEETYASQGLEKPASHTGIKVEVGKNASGTPVLKLKSNQAINEPFLDMLIQVDWSTGRLLREYTVLLDPPGYTGEVAAASPAVVDNPTVESSATPNQTASQTPNLTQEMGAESKPAAAKGKSKKSAKKKIADTEAMTPSAEITGTEYTTVRGDTLMKIANETKPEGVSLDQMLVGLYDANPDAFSGKNMNRLKVGQIIRQPAQDALNAISKNEAQKEIKVQTANWNEYRHKVAGMVADAPAEAADTTVQSSSGKIKGAAEDKSTQASNSPKDVVKLSAAESANNNNAAKSAQAKITALQEEATARENSVKEAQSRAADLEKQISDMQKLLALKNNAMADLQKQADAKSNQTPAVAAQPAQAVDAARPAEPVAAVVADKPAEVISTPEAVKPVVSVEPVKPAPAKAAPVLPPAPIEEEGFVASLLSNLDITTIAPVGGVLALLGGGWLFLRNKRKRNLADFEQGIMTSGGLKANTVFGNTSGTSVDTGDTSFLTDFSQSGSAGMIDTNDVDPIAEAEVYMAYGRDAQAEEILKDAIVKEPKRYELHLKLLEMYAASKNNSAFEAISGELYTSLGAESPVWAKVAEIGIQLEPNNPLYQLNALGNVANASAQASQSLNENPNVKSNETTADSDKSSAEVLDISDFSDIPLADESDLDLSVGQMSKVRDAASDKAGTATISDDFDLDFDSESMTSAKPNAEMKAEGLSFELPNTAVSGAAPTLAPSAGSDLNFDIGELGLDFNASAEPADEASSAVNASSMSKSIGAPAIEAPVTEAPMIEAPMIEVPFFAMSSTAENSLDVDTISDQANAPFFAAPNPIDLDVKTGIFPATYVPNDAAATDVVFAELDESFVADGFSADNSSLDVPTISQEAADFMKADFNEANAVDISSISLDLNDVPTISDEAEPADVETKLELVAAYIDMDDAEGAKELIAEVMAEGGNSQRKRAEALLAQLA